MNVNWDDEIPNIWKNKHVPVTTKQFAPLRSKLLKHQISHQSADLVVQFPLLYFQDLAREQTRPMDGTWMLQARVKERYLPFKVNQHNGKSMEITTFNR